MPEWLQNIVWFFKEYGGLVSCVIFIGYVLLQLYKDWKAANFEKERVAREKAMQKELHELRTRLERKAVIDDELRKDLAQVWVKQAEALRAKLAYMLNTARSKSELLKELLAARGNFRNRFYDSLYLPQALIEAMREFDGFLKDEWTSKERLYSANTKIREAMRAAAGLNYLVATAAEPKAATQFGEAQSVLMAEAGTAADMADAKELLVNAITRITLSTGDGFARMSQIKPAMLKLDPAFDQAAYEFETFSQFVNECTDLVSVIQGPFEKHVSILGTTKKSEPASASANSDLEYYRQILRQQQYKMLPGNRFIALCHAVCAAAKDGPFASWDDFRERVQERVSPDLQAVLVDTDLARFKQLLFKNHVFDLKGPQAIFVEQEVSSPEAMVELVFRNTIRRLLSQPDLKWDAKAASQLLYEDETHEVQVAAWHAELMEGEAGHELEPSA